VQHDFPQLSTARAFLVRLVLIPGLVVVAAACGSSSSVTEPDSEMAELRAENADLRDKLQEARTEAASLQRGETIKVLSTDVYFRSGSADLTDKGVQELQKVAQRIRTEYPDRTIRVEGYTDSKPIGDKLDEKYPSNWELSAARAARVVRHFQWTHDMAPKRFEVVGFGPYHPVASNETAEGRRKNRRVRVAVLSESPEGAPQAE
jgi:chemotaxis protein MotB